MQTAGDALVSPRVGKDKSSWAASTGRMRRVVWRGGLLWGGCREVPGTAMATSALTVRLEGRQTGSQFRGHTA